MDKLNTIVKDYIRFVFSWDEDDDGKRWSEKTETNTPEFDNYLEDNFKFSAVYNWECGFDIVEWYEGIGDYAEDGHYKCGRQGEVADIIDFNPSQGDYSHEMALRNYACSYLYHMSVEDLRSLLRKSVCS